MSQILKIKKCVLFILTFSSMECHTWKGVARQSNMTGHIINGVFSSISMYPYMALLTVAGDVHCGGAVVSRRVILTAAHCLGVRFKHLWITFNLNVYLGSAKAMEGKKYKVCKTLPHPNFVRPELTNSYDDHDIGLILLKKKIKLGPTVQIATLSSNSRWKKKVPEVTVIGFGSTATIKGPPSKTLQMTRQKYVDEETCYNSQYGSTTSNDPLTDRFCLIGENWNSACFGDSGSPVIWKSIVVGLVSSGRSNFCGSDMMPTMYTDVGYYYKWIRSNIKYLESERNKCRSRTTKLVINTTTTTSESYYIESSASQK